MTKNLRYIKNGLSLLLKNKYFTFSEKMSVLKINDIKRDSAVYNLLRKKLFDAENGEKFFLIGGYKIFFQPDYKIFDAEFFLKGISQVLKDTFVFPVFFNSKVQIKNGDVVLDIGACIGTTALLFSEMVGERGKVFAFEPVTYRIIQRNSQVNNIKNIEIITKGIADKNERLEIEKSDYCVDCSICKREYTKGYYKSSDTIEVMSIDEFCEEAGLPRVDFIKLDIEGAEELAIRGARKTIDKYRPKLSISSYHIDFNNEQQHDKLVRLLKEFGYRIDEEKEFHIYAW